MTTSQSKPAPAIAVVGSSGQQGGATAGTLIDAGADVRAVVRNAGSGAANRHRERGAQLVTADLDREQTLVAAFRGAVSGDDDQQAVFGWFVRPPAYQADFEPTRDLDPTVWDFRASLANQ